MFENIKEKPRKTLKLDANQNFGWCCSRDNIILLGDLYSIKHTVSNMYKFYNFKTFISEK